MVLSVSFTILEASDSQKIFWDLCHETCIYSNAGSVYQVDTASLLTFIWFQWDSMMKQHFRLCSFFVLAESHSGVVLDCTPPRSLPVFPSGPDQEPCFPVILSYISCALSLL